MYKPTPLCRIGNMARKRKTVHGSLTRITDTGTSVPARAMLSQKLREKLLDNIEDIADAITEKALDGDLQAATILFDRVLGKAPIVSLDDGTEGIDAVGAGFLELNARVEQILKAKEEPVEAEVIDPQASSDDD